MSEIKIVLVDFLNYYIEGLSKRDLMIIQKETGVMEKGAFMLASYKSGIWDGKTAYINDDGVGMVRDLPRVLDVIEGTLGYTDVDFVDSRPIKLLRLPTVDEEWLKDETGYSLYDYQVNGINAAVGLTHCDSGIGGILKLATNSGKCQRFDAKVLTPTGWRTMGELEVGDSVIGSDGKAKKILDVYDGGVKNIYEVKTNLGRKMQSCGDHLYPTHDKSSKCKGKDYKNRPLSTLMKGLRWGDGGNKWQMMHLGSPVEFESIGDVPLDPYLLGLMIGDGCLRHAMNISVTEVDIRGRIKEIVENYGQKISEMSDGTGVSILRASRTSPSPIKEIIESLDLNCYSYEKHIPEVYQYASIDERVELLRGLMDTDGWIDKKYPHIVAYDTSSPKLADDVVTLVEGLGGYASITIKQEPTYEYLGEKLIGRPSYGVYIRFRNGIVPVSSEKHLAKYKTRLSDQFIDSISSVELVGREPTKCIMIDSVDHLYVTDDYLMTHNTMTTMGISKVFDKKIKTVVIVPSTNLVEQTYADYCKSDMSTVALLAKIPPKQRENAINNHDHVILTGKLFLNVHKFFQRDEWVVMYDEVHEFGEMMSQAIRESLGHCQYRIGLTATMPEEKKDFYKDGLIRNHFGDNLVQMEQKELIDRGISSAIHIDMVTVSTPVDAISLMSDDWDWNKELLYYNTNALRCDAFLEQIKKESCGNNLILCAPELGEVLAERLGINLVQDSVPSDQRGIWYAEFKEASDYSLLATFGCASTGLSINNIQTLFLLEIGKDRTRIMQSIGRGLRLDGKENFIRVVDISSCTKYARNHRKERLKIYNAEGFSNEAYKEIVVDHDSPFGE